MSEHTRRQHYIPKFLIKGFAKETTLFRLDKTDPKSAPVPVSPENLFVEKDYYTLDINDTERRYSIESQLASLEGKAAPIIQRMISEVRGRRDELSVRPEEKVTLCEFLTTLYSRNPRTGEKAAAAIRNRGLVEAESDMAAVRDLQRCSILWRNRSKKEMESMGMSLYRINGDPIHGYILGDMPVTAHPNPCPNPDTTTREWLLLAPISYDVCLSLSTGYAGSNIVGIGQADTQMTNDVNRWIYSQSWKAVAGCCRELLIELRNETR